jgi:hypothetical protein
VLGGEHPARDVFDLREPHALMDELDWMEAAADDDDFDFDMLGDY